MESLYSLSDGVLRFSDDLTNYNSLSLKEVKPLIEEVIIPDNMEMIRAWLFKDCGNLKKVSFGHAVKDIDKEAFKGCVKLESLNFPESLVRISESAFEGCLGLTSLTITDGVREVWPNAFKDCTGLKTVHVGKSVDFFSSDAFEGCNNIERFTVDPDNAKYDSRQDCNSLIDGDRICMMSRNSFIPDGIKSLDSIIYKGFESIDMPGTIEDIRGGAFAGCSRLTSLQIPPSVKYIGLHAFADCSSLTSILIPNSVVMVGTTWMGDGLFSGCAKLKKVEVEPGCRNLDSREGCNGIIATHTNTFLSGCNHSFIPRSVTSIGDYTFYGCQGLESIEIPDSVTRIGKAILCV